VRAIAAQDRLGDVAPSFIDAAALPAQTWPRGGLTVLTFVDNHLIYAITWFGMALGLAIASVRILYVGPHRRLDDTMAARSGRL
jgi:surfeit locus 1 family protein